MAKAVKTTIKVNLKAGEASPAPPLGPALGQHGVAIMDFVKAYNERTSDMKGEVVPAVITVYEDRSFTFEIKKAPVADIDQGDSDEGQGDDDQDKSVSLSDLGVKKAVALIAETFNTELLREWQEVATRKKVISAIEKQFKAIEEARIQDTDGQGDDASVE